MGRNDVEICGTKQYTAMRCEKIIKRERHCQAENTMYMIASDIHGTKQTSFWIVLSKLKIQGDFIPCSSIFSSQRRTEIHNINI